MGSQPDCAVRLTRFPGVEKGGNWPGMGERHGRKPAWGMQRKSNLNIAVRRHLGKE
jgi:hypothetical protein